MHSFFGNNNQQHEDLFNAVRRGNFEATQSLLEKGLDPNKRNVNGDCLMHFAIVFDYEKIVKLLLHKKVSINKCCTLNMLPIELAIREERLKSIQILLDYKPNTEQEKMRSNALILAIEYNNLI